MRKSPHIGKKEERRKAGSKMSLTRSISLGIPDLLHILTAILLPGTQPRRGKEEGRKCLASRFFNLPTKVGRTAGEPDKHACVLSAEFEGKAQA